MDSSFGMLDAFAFVVFAVLIFVGVIIVVSLGKLPGQLAQKWNHPQASAINAMSAIGAMNANAFTAVSASAAASVFHHGMNRVRQ